MPGPPEPLALHTLPLSDDRMITVFHASNAPSDIFSALTVYESTLADGNTVSLALGVSGSPRALYSECLVQISLIRLVGNATCEVRYSSPVREERRTVK
jgi:hypothetical protein